jgi:Flp pilus assembly protein TadG
VTSQCNIAALKSRAAAFGRHEDGAVAMIFALATVPVCLALGLAIDFSRSVHMNQKLTTAMDAATVAAAKSVKDGQLDDAQVKAQALQFFRENVRGNYAVYDESQFDVQIDRANSRVDITLPAYVPTTFARVANIDRMKINQKATAVFAIRDIEVGLALDVTGSMNCDTSKPTKKNPCPKTGTIKIEALKTAFEKFAKLMLPDTPTPGQKVRLGLAPYSASINLGTYANAASGGASADNCVTERTAVASLNSDLAPGGLDVFRVASDNKFDIDPTDLYGGAAAPGVSVAYLCPKQVIMPMTDDRAALINSVNNYGAGNGWTAGHIGAQWAWNLVSPAWKDVWGAASTGDAYSNTKVLKAVILMTDGVFNTAYHNDTSAQQAIALCQKMKARGVQVFSLAFGLHDAAAKDTLKTCASSGDDYFVDAADAAQLDEAFAKFAGKINALRLAQ